MKTIAAEKPETISDLLDFLSKFKTNMETQPPVINESVAPGGELFTPRQITDHKVNGLNEAISVAAFDAPGPGGANHTYALCLREKPEWPDSKTLVIEFQKGPILESGFNGFTNEALLAVLIDRMRGFQGQDIVISPSPTLGNLPGSVERRKNPAPFACRENALALTHLEEALMWLQKRTRDRVARGVEGTLVK